MVYVSHGTPRPICWTFFKASTYQCYVPSDTHSWSAAPKGHVYGIHEFGFLFVLEPSFRTELIRVGPEDFWVSILCDWAHTHGGARGDVLAFDTKSIWSIPQKLVGNGRQKPHCFLADSNEVGHLLRLLVGDGRCEAVCVVESVNLTLKSFVNILSGANVVQTTSHRDRSCVGTCPAVAFYE